MGNHTPKLPPATEEQNASLAALEARWAAEDRSEQAADGAVQGSRSLTVREASALRWEKPRESIAAIIAGLEDDKMRTGTRALVAIAYDIAKNGKYDRDRLKATELLLAYAEGRPAQTILTADVTPAWLESQIRARHPEFTDDQVLNLIAKLAQRNVLPQE